MANRFLTWKEMEEEVNRIWTEVYTRIMALRDSGLFINYQHNYERAEFDEEQ